MQKQPDQDPHLPEDEHEGDPEPERPKSFWFFVIAGALAGLLLVGGFLAQDSSSGIEQLKASDFSEELLGGNVEEVTINSQEGTILAEFTDREGEFLIQLPPDYQITQKLEEFGVAYKVNNEQAGPNTMLIMVFGIAAFVAILLLLNRGKGDEDKKKNNSGRMVDASQVGVTFEDVAGCDEVVQELEEIKEFLADPERFRELGANIPRGVLLFGPPGTGKTLLARAVAGEAGVPFFSISGSDFVEMYVGVGASRVRKLFEDAKSHAPCVIFIDEIDAVGRRRSGSSQGGQEERENTLNQLLVEIDGFSQSENVIVMAASNRADILDPALTRPGRFDRQVIVDIPDRNGRHDILTVHAKDKPFADSVTLESIAGQTAGFSGADLANLINEAALLAARDSRKQIEKRDIEEATMRVLAGPQKNRLMTENEKWITAVHEMGHAIVAHDLPDAEPVHKVTVVGRGRALGLTVMLQDGDKLNRSRSELKAQMAVALGGRVAEEIIIGDITTGAANDLERVTQVAQSMVVKLGMAEGLPLRAYAVQEQMIVHSDDLSGRLDAEIDALVAEAKLMAHEILLEKKDVLENISRTLLKVETLERDEFEQLMDGANPDSVPYAADSYREQDEQEQQRRLQAVKEAEELLEEAKQVDRHTKPVDEPGSDDETRAA